MAAGSPSPQALLPLALTAGDPAGIGLDITLAAWLSRTARGLAPFVMIGPTDALRRRARDLSLNVPITIVKSFADGAANFATTLPVIDIPLATTPRAGQPDPANAAGIIRAIELGVDAVLSGEAKALVTNPIAKHVLHDAGFKHPGHTEFLAALAEQAHGRRYHPVMMLASDALKVVPLTIHIPLRHVPAAITPELIIETTRITHAALINDFGLASPRIAITGLNPHAGENGSIGDEDARLITPAIASLEREGLRVTGPHPADTLFHAEARARYDAVIAMYHDQALIPIKTLAFDSGVNTTLGLPFVRTSPDHGTAFDIAGRGKASAESLIQALLLASHMAACRARQASTVKVS